MYTLLIRLMVIAALIKLGLLAKGWVGPKDIQRASLGLAGDDKNGLEAHFRIPRGGEALSTMIA